jgi:N-acetyl-1-D-myo-inositol-2-amino-2-deoxy-alpha-D-glucopyranoside deacetylase
MSEKQVLLAVLAHPDDETFGIGGTLALYARRGVEVHLICATRGEAGEVAQEYMEGFDSIADRRVSELHCAAGILGLAGVHFLDYRDSGMSGSQDNQHPQALINAPLEEAAERVAHLIRKLQPQVVITFDPIGGYKHPDHIAIHRATVRAFHLAEDENFRDELPPFKPNKLYYHLFPKGFLRWTVRLMRLVGRDPRRFGKNGDIDLLSIVEDGNFPAHAKIDYRQVEEKRQAAAACHASQLRGMPRSGCAAWVMRLFDHHDSYMRAEPAVNGRVREKDLFAGI